MELNFYNIILLLLVVMVTGGSWLWRYKIKPYYARRVLYNTLKIYPHWQQLIKVELFLKKLYQNISGMEISKLERKRLDKQEDAFVYGEIDFLPFYTILEQVRPESHEVFYDLGSGAGKAVLAAASFFSLQRVYGIELLPGLYELACAQQKKAEAWAQNYTIALSKIVFIQDDFLNYDISSGDIIFINATCVNYVTWQKLIEKFLLLKKGSRLIVTTKKITHPAFQVLSATYTVMSWGVNSVNSYLKIQ